MFFASTSKILYNFILNLSHSFIFHHNGFCSAIPSCFFLPLKTLRACLCAVYNFHLTWTIKKKKTLEAFCHLNDRVLTSDSLLVWIWGVHFLVLVCLGLGLNMDIQDKYSCHIWSAVTACEDHITRERFFLAWTQSARGWMKLFALLFVAQWEKDLPAM